MMEISKANYDTVTARFANDEGYDFKKLKAIRVSEEDYWLF